MKKFFLITLFFLVFLTYNIFPSQIKGIIKDLNNQPLEAIKITLKKGGVTFYSDKNGMFFIPVLPEEKEVVLIFSSDNHYPLTKRLKINRKNQIIEVLLIPKEHLKEEISVTAMNVEEESTSVPTAESVISELEIKEKIADNVVGTLLESPGVHFIGKGGFSITPSIRGLARRRVLILLDGARVTSDRRAGASASFVPPELVKRIEVVRSSSSVLYGSDAMGGVIHIMTRSPDESSIRKNTLNLNLNSINQRINTGIFFNQRFGKSNIRAGFQYTHSSNYQSPDREIFHSGYSVFSGILDVSLQSKKRDVCLGYLGGMGKNIGKPSRDNDPEKYDIVPVEDNHLIKLMVTEKNLIRNGTFNLFLYLNPTLYKLEKTDHVEKKYQQSDSRSFNYIIKTNLKKNISSHLSYQAGFNLFARRHVDIKNSITEINHFTQNVPLKNGKRSDLGLFFAVDYSGLPTLDIMGGIRYTFFSLSARVNNETMEKKSDAPSAFFGITKKFGDTLSVFFNFGKAFRLPSITEAYYTGITGRKYVIGNPDLKPESSFNFDTGIKFFSKKIFLGLYFFYYRINDMIERYRNEENIYTYDNNIRGRIYGGEVEFQYFPAKNIELFGHYYLYEGKSFSPDQPLNDVPPPHLFIGGKFFFDRLWFEINHLYSFKKNNPGPAEIKNEGYHLLNVKGGYYFSSRLLLYLKISNVLNQWFYANPDPDIPESEGMGVSAGLHCYF